MIAALQDRIAQYRLNTPGSATAWNLLMFALIGYVIWSAGSPVAQAAIGGAVLAGLASGAAIIPLSRWRFRLAVRTMTTVRWVAIGLWALYFFKIVPLPGVVLLTGLAMLMWSLSASFWLVSEPTVLTQTGEENLLRRAASIAPPEEPLGEHELELAQEQSEQPAALRA